MFNNYHTEYIWQISNLDYKIGKLLLVRPIRGSQCVFRDNFQKFQTCKSHWFCINKIYKRTSKIVHNIHIMMLCQCYAMYCMIHPKYKLYWGPTTVLYIQYSTILYCVLWPQAKRKKAKKTKVLGMNILCLQ